MERRPTRPRFDAGSGSSPRRGLFQRGESDRPWSVLVSDPDHTRRQVASRVIAECGAEPRWIESAFSDVPFPPSCGLAVVAPGTRPAAGSPDVGAIGALTRRGLTVLCYEDGARAWPLSVKCRALLAGASALLDSGTPEFAEELRHLLSKFLRAEAVRWAEEERITHAMDRLGIVGRSPAMLAVFRWVVRVSKLSDLPALITGETGTGKQLLAHAIHQLDDKRRKGPFPWTSS